MHAGPVRERGSGDDQWTKQIGPNRSQDHDRPAGLAIAYDAGLPVSVWMETDHLFDEQCLGTRDTLDRLARHRLRQEADEVAGMSRLHRDADLAVGLEPADAWTVSGAWINHHERPPRGIDLDAGWRDDADKRVIDGFVQLAAIDDQFGRILQNVGGGLDDVLPILVAAPAHHIEKEYAPLSRIDHVFNRGGDEAGHRTTGRSRHFHLHAPTSVSYEYIQSPPQLQAFDIGQCWTASTPTQSCHVGHPARMCRADCRDSGRPLFAGP